MRWWMWVLILVVLGILFAPLKLRILRKMLGKEKGKAESEEEGD